MSEKKPDILLNSYYYLSFNPSIIGHHTNMAVSQTPSTMIKSFLTLLSPRLVLEPHEDAMIVPYTGKLLHALRETGYLHLQATRPDTVGEQMALFYKQY